MAQATTEHRYLVHARAQTSERTSRTHEFSGHSESAGCVSPVVASQPWSAKEVINSAAQTLDVALGRSLRVWIQAPVLGMT
jgi:hypothetical protein